MKFDVLHAVLTRNCHCTLF